MSERLIVAGSLADNALLVVAIAMHLKATPILITDRRWPKLSIPVIVAR